MSSRVLVVEKEPVVRELLAELLDDGVREVLRAATAAEALQHSGRGASIHVVLAERDLPDQSGLELVRSLKERDPSTEVLLMSSAPSLDAVLEAVDAGASDYLAKPFEDINQVAIRVKTAEERALLRRERERLDQALVESEERYRKLFEASPDAVVVYDENTGLIAEANAAALSLYGYGREDFIGLPVARLRYATRRSAAAPPRDSEGSGNDDGGLIRRHDVTCQGDELEVELVRGRFRAQKRDMAVEIIRDIGERLRAERARMELQEQLRQSQKMEALGRLAGGIAHDFNNLLTVILNYASFAAKSLKRPAPPEALQGIHDDVEQILQAATSATSVTRQLLAFSRREVVHTEVLSVNEVVGAIEKLLRRTLGESVELDVRLSPAARAVLMDRAQLEQVIINLAVNARDAMLGGGTLSIVTDYVASDSPEEATDPPGWVTLEVADSGSGMAPEVMDQIFEPFYTTKERGKGTGLGLATVRGIVDQAGGTIAVRSEPGLGTTFTIRLPATRRVQSAVIPARMPSGAPRGESVLVVDDDDAVRRAICRMLRDEGYTVSEARNGKDALVAYDEMKGDLDLLLTDVVMPGMSGEELAETLREQQPTLRVVYTTGYATSTVVERTGKRDRRVVLPKPFREERLLQVVRETLEAGLGP